MDGAGERAHGSQHRARHVSHRAVPVARRLQRTSEGGHGYWLAGYLEDLAAKRRVGGGAGHDGCDVGGGDEGERLIAMSEDHRPA